MVKFHIPRRMVLLVGILLCVNSCQLPPPTPPGSEVKKAIVPEAQAVTTRNVSGLNDVARYLAGMPGGINSPLTEARQTEHWSRYSRNMDELWRRFSVMRQPRIASFSRNELGALRSMNTVWYPFSGPDILFADSFFPNAGNYVLCGLEGSEMLPDTVGMSERDREAGLNGLYTSLTTALNCSFFITKDMRVDLQRTSFRGTLPIVMVFLARLGYDIQNVEAISLDSGGNVSSGQSRGSCHGYVVRYSASFGRSKSIYYFTENLADFNLRNDRRYLSFVRKFGRVATYLKSASYLMHSDEFSMIRNAILEQSAGVLQDDSGIALSGFGSAWNLRFFGNYTGVLDIFSSYYQPKLAEIYREGGPNVSHINFGLGYKFEAGESSLLLARKP